LPAFAMCDEGKMPSRQPAGRRRHSLFWHWTRIRESCEEARLQHAKLQAGGLVAQHGLRQAVVVAGLCVGDFGLSLLQLGLAEFDDRA
jgi:hypothetical protein